MQKSDVHCTWLLTETAMNYDVLREIDRAIEMVSELQSHLEAARAEISATPEPADRPTPPQRPNNRQPSQTVENWRAQPPLPHHGVITVNPPHCVTNPKRRKARERFALYEDGMTVSEYIEASKRAGNSAALAAADVRWDFVKGFISVQQ
jgi:hypothetical protein